jgi:trimethylguanosine synthase
VICSDLDETKVHHTIQNCEIYNCQENVEGITTDFLELPSKLKSLDPNEDIAVFLSPPWGGESYGTLDVYTLDCMFPSFRDILKASLKLSTNLAIYLPRNTDIKELTTTLSKMFAQQQ